MTLTQSLSAGVEVCSSTYAPPLSGHTLVQPLSQPHTQTQTHTATQAMPAYSEYYKGTLRPRTAL